MDNTTDSATPQSPTQQNLWSALLIRNVRSLWIGETFSQLGDQFYLIGLPLVILSLTGSAAQFGLVLFIEGVPRAALMLVGGVITDRMSPRKIMLYSNMARLFLTALLGLLILTQTLQIWMLFIIAFIFGTVDAFFQPAFMAILPTLIPPDQLQAGNSLMQSSNQLVQAVGPGIAGVVVGTLGIGIAVLLDAVSFLITTVLLLSMRTPTPIFPADSGESRSVEAIVADLTSMIRYVWNNPVLRPYMLLIVMLNLTLVGPVTLGAPIMAKALFEGSAVALGWMLSAIGIGAVLGSLAASLLRIKRFGTFFLAASAFSSLLIMAVSISTALWTTALLFGGVGFILGVTNVLLLTWFGRQIPANMLGRFMGLYVLLGVGIAPLSNAIAGVLLGISIPGTFLIAGSLQLTVCIVALFSPTLRRLEI